MANLNNPAPGLLLRGAPLDCCLRSATDDVRDVAVALDGAQMLGTTVACVGAKVFVSPVGWILAFDDNGAEYRIKPLAVVDVGPAHDERQRDATAVHQQVAFASLFSPGPSGSGRQLLVPRVPSSSRHRRFAIATRCLACRRIPPNRLSRRLQRSPPSPIRESVCGWRWVPAPTFSSRCGTVAAAARARSLTRCNRPAEWHFPHCAAPIPIAGLVHGHKHPPLRHGRDSRRGGFARPAPEHREARRRASQSLHRSVRRTRCGHGDSQT